MLGRRGLREIRERSDQSVLRGELAPKAPRESQGHKAFRELPVLPARQGLKALRVLLAKRAQRVRLARRALRVWHFEGAIRRA